MPQLLMILSFSDRATEDLYHGRRTGRIRQLPANLRPVILRRLDMLDAATRLDDLMIPPSNRLEALLGDLAGFYSIRVNEQWRIIFRWDGGDASAVALTDYH